MSTKNVKYVHSDDRQALEIIATSKVFYNSRFPLDSGPGSLSVNRRIVTLRQIISLYTQI